MTQDKPIVPLSEAELEAMQARAKAATPGPWRLGFSDGIVTYVNAGRKCAAKCDTWQNGRSVHKFNGAFIAAARTDVPRLLAELAAWRKAGRDIRNGQWAVDTADALFAKAVLARIDELLPPDQKAEEQKP